MSKQKRMERLHAREVVLFKKKCRGEATKAEKVNCIIQSLISKEENYET